MSEVKTAIDSLRKLASTATSTNAPTMWKGSAPKKPKTAEPDYAQYSVSTGSKRNGTSIFAKGDSLYDYVNDIGGYRKTADLIAAGTGSGNAWKKYDNLTADEIGTYNYIYAKQGKNEAEKFLDGLSLDLDKRQYAAHEAYVKDLSNKNPVLTSIASVPANLIGGAVGAVDLAVQGLRKIATGKDINFQSAAQSVSSSAGTARGQISQNIEASTSAKVGNTNVASFLYNTAMSAADSISAMAFGNPALAGLTLGLGAGADTARDIAARGGSDAQAIVGGIVAGTFEALFERISLGNLKALKELPVKSIKSVLTNIAKSMGVNASEEGATELANILFDAIAMGDVSNWQQSVEEYKKQGKTEKEAKRQTVKDLLAQVLQASASGGAMGAFFGGGGSVASAISNRQNAQTVTPLAQPQAAQATTSPVAAISQTASVVQPQTVKTERTTESAVENAADSNTQPMQSGVVTNANTAVTDVIDGLLSKAKNNTVNIDEIYAILSELTIQNKDINYAQGFLNAMSSGQYGLDAKHNVYKTKEADHIDNRSMQSVGSRNVKAFQFLHPKLQKYFAEAAGYLSYDLDNTVRGERGATETDYSAGNEAANTGGFKWWGTKRLTTSDIAYLKDTLNLSYDDIYDATERIINDKGNENVASAKRIELMLDNMLTNGHTLIDGTKIPPNQEYIAAKAAIVGAKEITGIGSDADDLPIYDLPSPATQPAQTNDGLGAMTPTRGPMVESQYAENTIPKSDISDEAKNAIDQIDTRHEQVSEDLSLDRAQSYFYKDSNGDIVNLDVTLKNLADMDAWGNAEVDASMLALQELDKIAQQTKDFTEVTKWAKIQQEHSTEQGKGLQAWAKWSRSATSAVANAARTLTNAGVSQAAMNGVLGNVAQYGARAEAAYKAQDQAALADLMVELSTERGYTPSKRIAGYVRTADIELLYDYIWKAVDGVVIDSIPPSLGQKVSAIQTMAQLINAKTFLRNLISNQVFSSIDRLANNIALLPDALTAMALKKQYKMTAKQLRTIGYEPSMLKKSVRQAIAKATRESATAISLDVNSSANINKYDTPTNRTFNRYKTDPAKTGVAKGLDILKTGIKNIPNKLEGVMGYELNYTDAFQKGTTTGQSQAALNPLVQSGGRVTEDIANEWTTSEADYRSFQRKTLLGSGLKTVKNLLNGFGIGKRNGKTMLNGKLQFAVKDFGLGDLTMKYTNVPGALVTTAVEYTPMGYLKAIYNFGVMAAANRQVAKGNAQDASTVFSVRGMTNERAAMEAQRQFAQSMGRAITGTGIIAIAGVLAKLGILMFHKDKDYDKQAAETAQGLTGLQLNLSALERLVSGESGEVKDGDTLISLDNLEPIKSLFEIGTRLEALDPESATFDNALAILGDSYVDSLQELSMMETMDTVISNFTYKDKDEPFHKTLGTTARDILGNAVTGFIPGPVRQTAQALDTNMRDTSADKWGERVLNSVRNTIPGLRQDLPIKPDNLGRNRDYTGNRTLDILNAYAMPGNISVVDVGYADKMLNNLSAVTGNDKLYPDRKAPTSIEYGKTTYNLTTEEKRDYQTIAGGVSNELITAFGKSDAYKDLPAEIRAAVVEKINQFAEDTAKGEFVTARGGEYTSDWDAERDLSDLPEYLAVKTAYSSMKNSGGADAETFTNILGVYDKLSAESKAIMDKMDGFADAVLVAKSGTDMQEYFGIKEDGKGKSYIEQCRIAVDADMPTKQTNAVLESLMTKETYDKYAASKVGGETFVGFLEELDRVDVNNSPSTADYLYAVVGTSASSKDEKAVLKQYLSEAGYTKYTTALDAGFSTKRYADFYAQKQDRKKDDLEAWALKHGYSQDDFNFLWKLLA